ncbi:MAG: hypothetical protein ACREHF_13865 [Rhizomicrobium sp.]
MNSITKTLLVGAAFCALATVPAVAGDVSNIHVFALHPGHATFVSKTSMHKGPISHTTSTISVSTSVPASDLHKKVKLDGTVFGFFCGRSGKVKITKKAIYGKVGIYTLTNSTACDGAGQVLYGDTYKLTNPEGEGKTDSFVSSLTSKFEYKGTKYKGTVNLDVSVAIGE